MPVFEKNIAPSASIALEMRDASGAFVSGSPTVTVSVGGAAYAAYGGSLAAISGATGEYEYTPSQAETNAGKFKVKAALTGAVTVTREVLPEPSYTAARAGYLDALNGIVASIWGYGARTLSGFGTLTSDVAAAVWGAATRTLSSAADSAGVTTLLGRLSAPRAGGLDYLDAFVSSRGTSNYGGGDTAGTTTLLSRLTPGRATNLDHLDAAVSSRSTYAGGAVLSVTNPVTVGTNADKTGYALAPAAAAFDGIRPNVAFFANSPNAMSQVTVSVPAVLPGYTIPEGDLPAIRRGDSWSAGLTGLGTLTSRATLWATAKRDARRTDGQADFGLTEALGLVTLAGAAPGAGQNGGLVVNDAAAGTATLTLSAAATAALGPGVLAFDVQILTGGAVKTLASGSVTVVADVTRAVA